jgi:hypothetical protein
MRKLALAAVAAMGVAGAADAAVVTLQGVAANGPNDFTYDYQITLGPDEGVRAGDRFVIFDFAGYLDGSVFTGDGNLATSVENVSAGTLVAPGQNDDPNIGNLVFTYTGPDFRTATGPLAPFSFPSLGARSSFGQTVIDAFFTRTTQNNPSAERGRPVFTLGVTSVPSAAIPEPASWALMIGGFGLVGASLRRRTRPARATA